ncbi:MAG: YidC/Oxa1 family membrane protein insertase [bacterium]
MDIKDVFKISIYVPILNVLIFFYVVFGHNLAFAISALTVLIRAVLIPVTLPALKGAAKQRELSPQIAELKEKYGKDKTLFAQKQMELYKQNGFNPAAGCLPQIVQLIVLIVLYQVLLDIFKHNPAYFNEMLFFPFMKFAQSDVFNTSFLYMDLAKKDPYYILPVLAGLSQFLLSKISMPQVNKMEKLAEKTPDKKDDVMYNMQKQMIFMMPVMTIFIGASLPSGLVLYWFLATVFGLIQQWLLNKKLLKK